MEEFSLNFNRIMAVLRDNSNGIYEYLGRDWKEAVMNSYR